MMIKFLTFLGILVGGEVAYGQVEPHGNAADQKVNPVTVNGTDQFHVTQSGHGNLVSFSQSDSVSKKGRARKRMARQGDNIVEYTEATDSVPSRNFVRVSQTGSGNTVIIQQSGVGNSVTVSLSPARKQK